MIIPLGPRPCADPRKKWLHVVRGYSEPPNYRSSSRSASRPMCSSARSVPTCRNPTASPSSPRTTCQKCCSASPCRRSTASAILAPEVWPAWLGEEPADEPQLKSFLAPYPSDEMICWPVSPRVGNVKNNDPSLIEPGFIVSARRCGLRRSVIGFCRHPGSGALKPCRKRKSHKRFSCST